MNKSGQVWIDKAINTLITPPADRDEGWKKIRRTKTRYELIRRCNTIELLLLSGGPGEIYCSA